MLTSSLCFQSVDQLAQLKQAHEVSRQHQWFDNTAAVLLGDRQRASGSAEASGERQVLDELERKYDVVLDKLLEQALRSQLGDAAWNAMTSDERQRHLVRLKLQNRKLREEGRLEEANELLGGLLEDDGESRGRRATCHVDGESRGR